MARRLIERLGFQVVRRDVDPQEFVYRYGGAAPAPPLPPEVAAELRSDHPHLAELRERYRRMQTPLTGHTLWSEDKRSDLDLTNFRGDNIYVWQLRNVAAQARLKYFLYGRYVRELDTRGLLGQLTEDGAFGCWRFEYQDLPPLSRDLLDSINEMYFLDREIGLFERESFTVLDIGAGYGRLAHRMRAVVPGLSRYWCVDAVPESTFLCEFYLGYRGCLDKATVVPLDLMAETLPVGDIDLAVNIHSFSEMRLETIAAWLDEIVRLRIEWLMIVPNEAERLLSWEADRSRENYLPLLESRGYRLARCEPIFRDRDLRELTGIDDHFLLFQQASPALSDKKPGPLR